MAERQITHIRQPYDKEGYTICGDTTSGSVSYMHMIKWIENKHDHIRTLEMCDDCYEEFKKDQSAFFYEGPD